MYRENQNTTTSQKRLPTFSYEDAEFVYRRAKEDIEARTRVLVEEKIDLIMDAVRNEIFLLAKKERIANAGLGSFIIHFEPIGIYDFKFESKHGDSQLVAMEIQKFFPGFTVERVRAETPGLYCLRFSRQQQQDE